MSLSSLLEADTPLRRWMCQTFPHLAPLREDWRARVAGFPTVRPPVGPIPFPYRLVGMAVDYRLRYALTLTPPDQLAAYDGAVLFDARWLGEIEIDADDPQRQMPSPRGTVTPTLVAALTADLTEIQPVGRWLDPAQEAWLDRWCLVLAAFEVLYRSGYGVPLPRAVLEALEQGRFDVRAADLDRAAVRDIGQVAQVFLGQDWPWERSPQTPSPWWSNPTFAGSHDVNGADADLIVDGCLIDIKTTIDPTRLDREWVYQLLGYVLLDYYDWYGLNTIGIYLARQGRLIRWSLTEWLPILTGRRDVSLAGLRVELREVLQDLREARHQARPARAADRLRRIG